MFEKFRKKLINEIANAVVNKLESQKGWHKFLPPVVIRDCMYMMTEDGEIYRMDAGGIDGMEMVIKISSRI